MLETPSDKAIVIENLTKHYKNGRGITDISMEISRGSIFGFLGPNGAGKTTAMKIMTGMMHADSGDVKINGISVRDDFSKAFSSAGCIIETAEVYPYLSAEENLRIVAKFYPGLNEERIAKALELTGIAKYRKEKAGNFSLGMKQRLGISAAILSEPEILILDEPLNGLDVEGMVEMRRLFKRLAEEKNTTIFISSHLVHDVELTCDTIGIIFAGKLLNVDTTANILKSHNSLENYFMNEVEKNGKL